ncbi:uncharacterized protein A4U43_C08F25160 [Asparagus officinalis]|nr:uncharacterized protein A4U43_C08F25160 [Asparagus officinalis]
MQHIKAIITADEVLLRDYYEDNVISIVEELRRRLPPANTFKQEHGAGKENSSGQHDVEGAEEDGECFLLLFVYTFEVVIAL